MKNVTTIFITIAFVGCQLWFVVCVFSHVRSGDEMAWDDGVGWDKVMGWHGMMGW